MVYFQLRHNSMEKQSHQYQYQFKQNTTKTSNQNPPQLLQKKKKTLLLTNNRNCKTSTIKFQPTLASQNFAKRFQLSFIFLLFLIYQVEVKKFRTPIVKLIAIGRKREREYQKRNGAEKRP